MFLCPLYDELRHVFFEKMSLLYNGFFYLDDYEKLELCFRIGVFHTANFICKAWERRKNVLYI